jgi:aminoglycoside/choline kinase family phosphotransferase
MDHAGGTAVPAALADITPEWMSAMLDVRVASFVVEPIGAAVGFLGQLARLHLSYERDVAGPASVIVKLPSAEAAALELAAIYRFYEREAGFYRHLAATPAGCGVPVPRCFATAGEGNEVALVLEDLCELRVGDQVAGAPLGDLRRALRTAADLHAAWWDKPALTSLEWMPYANAPVYKAAAVNYPLAWPFFVEGYGDKLTPTQRSIGERLCDQVDALIDDAAKDPLTVNHGDFRLDNLFFSDDDDEPCTVIDWQISSRARTGCLDVAYFLSGNLDPDQLDAEFDPLLHGYHEHLVAGGVRGFSFADFEEAMRLAALSCLAYPVLGATVLAQEDPRAVALFDRMILGYFGLAEQLDAGSVL